MTKTLVLLRKALTTGGSEPLELENLDGPETYHHPAEKRGGPEKAGYVPLEHDLDDGELEEALREHGFREVRRGPLTKAMAPALPINAEQHKAADAWYRETTRGSKVPVAKLRRVGDHQIRHALAHTRIHINLDNGALQGVLGEGRFKTAFDDPEGAAQSFGSDYIDHRVKREQQSFGIPPETPAEHRPVYGYVADPAHLHEHFPDVEEYGDAAARLKPSVHARTTVTVGDTGAAPRPAVPYTNPTHHAVEPAEVGGWRRPHQVSHYIEAQVHGGVSASDIEHVHFFGKSPSASLQGALAKHGISWSHGEEPPLSKALDEREPYHDPAETKGGPQEAGYLPLEHELSPDELDDALRRHGFRGVERRSLKKALAAPPINQSIQADADKDYKFYGDAVGFNENELASHKDKAREQLTGALQDTRIHVNVPSKTLNKIITDGRFKTQFETKHSTGLYAPSIRATAEQRMFGLDESHTEPQHRPVYGYVSHPESLGRKSHIVKPYGDATIRLKPSVHERTTVTVHDSLFNLHSDELGRPAVPYMNPTHHAVPPGEVGEWSHPEHVNDYIEAQVHGGVGLSDIEHVQFNAEPPSTSLRRKLKVSGVAWSHPSTGMSSETLTKTLVLRKAITVPGGDEPKGPGEMHSSEFLPESSHYHFLTAPYENGQSSRTNQNTGYPKFKPGTWMRDNDYSGPYGHDISQLRMIEPEKLRTSEETLGGKLEDVKRYADWMQAGHTPPPASGIEYADGSVRLTDGHRRMHAAKLAGTKLPVWVRPAADTGLREPNGKPILTNLTHEMAIHQRLQQGKSVPHNVRQEYEQNGSAKENIQRHLPLNESQGGFMQKSLVLLKSFVSADRRHAYAAKGWALKDGSYPIPDRGHLESAITLAQSGHGDVDAAWALIHKRAKELGADDMLPASHGGKVQKSLVLRKSDAPADDAPTHYLTSAMGAPMSAFGHAGGSTLHIGHASASREEPKPDVISDTSEPGSVDGFSSKLWHTFGESDAHHLPDVEPSGVPHHGSAMHHFAPHDDHPGRTFIQSGVTSTPNKDANVYSEHFQHHAQALLAHHPEMEHNIVHVDGVELPHDLGHLAHLHEHLQDAGEHAMLHGFAPYRNADELPEDSLHRKVIASHPELQGNPSVPADLSDIMGSKSTGGRATGIMEASPHGQVFDATRERGPGEGPSRGRIHMLMVPARNLPAMDGHAMGSPQATKRHIEGLTGGYTAFTAPSPAIDVHDQLMKYHGMHPADIHAEFEKPRDYGEMFEKAMAVSEPAEKHAAPSFPGVHFHVMSYDQPQGRAQFSVHKVAGTYNDKDTADYWSNNIRSTSVTHAYTAQCDGGPDCPGHIGWMETAHEPSMIGAGSGKAGPPLRKALVLKKSTAAPRAAWHMGRQAFMSYSPNAEGSIGADSLGPADVPDLRAAYANLRDYTSDEDAIKGALGKGTRPRYDMSHLSGRVKRGDKIKVYRVANSQDEIFPGNTVTVSPQLATEHTLRAGRHGGGNRVLETEAYPHEILHLPGEDGGMNLIYAPADVGEHHKHSVLEAMKRGENVPAHVKADYGLR